MNNCTTQSSSLVAVEMLMKIRTLPAKERIEVYRFCFMDFTKDEQHQLLKAIAFQDDATVSTAFVEAVGAVLRSEMDGYSSGGPSTYVAHIGHHAEEQKRCQRCCPLLFALLLFITTSINYQQSPKMHDTERSTSVLVNIIDNLCNIRFKGYHPFWSMARNGMILTWGGLPRRLYDIFHTTKLTCGRTTALALLHKQADEYLRSVYLQIQTWLNSGRVFVVMVDTFNPLRFSQFLRTDANLTTITDSLTVLSRPLTGTLSSDSARARPNVLSSIDEIIKALKHPRNTRLTLRRRKTCVHEMICCLASITSQIQQLPAYGNVDNWILAGEGVQRPPKGGSFVGRSRTFAVDSATNHYQPHVQGITRVG